MESGGGGSVGFSGGRFEMKRFHSIPFKSIPFHSNPIHSIPFHVLPNADFFSSLECFFTSLVQTGIAELAIHIHV